MAKPTYDQIARDYNLWQEYADPFAAISEIKFNRMSHADRVSLMIETFGPEIQVPTVEEMLESTAVGNGFHDWGVEGGIVQVTEDQLRPALEAVYDSANPDWFTMIDICFYPDDRIELFDDPPVTHPTHHP